MSLLPTEEQRELERSLRDFLSQEVSTEYLRKRIASNLAPDSKLASALGDLGFVPFFASADADVRPGVQEIGIIARECGRALLPEPLVENITAGTWLLFQFLDDAQREVVRKHFGESFLAAIESGGQKVTLAGHTFVQPLVIDRRNKAPVVRISGTVRFVSGAEDAKYMVLCGKTAEEKEGSLYLLSLTGSKEQIVKRTAVPSLDLSRRYFDLELQNVAALQLGAEQAKGVFQVHGAVVASELAGIAAKVVEMTVEYVKTRKQFNVPIGTFQAVQHKIADMYLQSEALRALSTFACWAAQHSQEQAQLSTLSALSFACEQAPLIAETAIQMHGGIGFTWEYELHLYLRRAKMVEMLYRASTESAAQIISAV